MTKLVKTLSPKYVKDFQCIGGGCEDTCCAGWHIYIDEATYKKYQQIKHGSMKIKMAQNIVHKDSPLSDDGMAKMRMNDNGCTFLTTEGLCEIQQELGEDYLCETCTAYPRILNKVNDQQEYSLSLSCPEAARLILLNKGGIIFDETISDIDETIDFSKKIATNPHQKTKWQDYFYQLRDLTISVLQNRAYTIDNRLITLALLFNQIDQCIKNNVINDIPLLVEQYQNNIHREKWEKIIANIPKNIELQINFCRELVDLRLEQPISSDRYLQCLVETLFGLNFKEGISIEENTEKYVQGYQDYYHPFMTEHDYLIENYLVNYVFKHCVPVDSESPVNSFARLLSHYLLIRFHLIGMSTYYETLTTERVLILIQSLAKTIEHNSKYLNAMIDLMEEHNYTTWENMIILIKL